LYPKAETNSAIRQKLKQLTSMEYRQLGNAGLRVPVLSLGTGTFGGTNDFFKKWGETDVSEATRLIDICLERGVNFFDTANVYSFGASEQILGAALKGKRSEALISTKAGFTMGSNTNDTGASRFHLIREVEASLKRLGTDYVDVYFIHAFDPLTPVEETLAALDHLVSSGKVRFIGCSNFTAWQVMKSLATSEKYGLAKYIVYQGYYSLIGREYEWELMPMAKDQNIGLMVWSALGWGRLTGKIRQGQPLGEGRIKSGGAAGGPEVTDEYLFKVINALDEVAAETGKSIPQVAINWLLQRPTVTNVVIGARNEKQLLENLDAVGWSLSIEQVSKLETASEQKKIYPHWVGVR
jgi:aryl-alcohol dehydrogenase-like predicted oxidoreductase